MKRIAMFALAASLATACQTNDDPDNQRALGAVGGAIAGAIISYSLFGNSDSNAILTLLGTGAGSVGGYYAVDEIIKRDKNKMQKAAFESLNAGVDGQAVYWENQDTGSAGSFTVLRSYQRRDGRLCRDFTATAMGDRHTTDHRRTACRLADGGWEVI